MVQLENAPKLVLTARIFRNIEDVPSYEWKAAFPDTLNGYDFLKTIEQSEFDQFSFYYILIYSEDRLVAAAPCFLMTYPLHTTVQGKFKKILGLLGKIFPGVFNLKILISGSPVCPGVIPIEVEEKNAVMKMIADSMEEISKEEKVTAIAFKDILEEHFPVFDALLEKDFFKVKTFPGVSMDIPFTSFDHYLKSLSSSTRYDLKRKFKKVDTLPKIEFRVSNHLEGLWDEAYELYLQTFLKSDIQFEKVPKDFFRNLSVNMPEQVRYFQWYINGKLEAFECCLTAGDTLMAEYIGLNYSVAHEYHLYFVRFRDLLNWCIENKIKKFDTGMMSYEPKKRLGFKADPFSAYVRHRNSLIHPIFKKICPFLEPGNFDQALREIELESV